MLAQPHPPVVAVAAGRQFMDLTVSGIGISEMGEAGFAFSSAREAGFWSRR